MPDERFEFSEEVQDIMGRIPGWITRWGITVIFVIFLGIIIACHFIKYPEVVSGVVTITTINPPADLHARATGRISQLFVKDGDRVEAGQLIALLYSPTDYGDLSSIIETLEEIKYIPVDEVVFQTWLDKEYNLGELQSGFLEYKRNCLNYRHYIQTDNAGKKQRLVQDQISKNTEYYQKLLAQQSTLEEDYNYARKNHQRDSLLFAKQVISLADYESSKQALIQKRMTKENMEGSVSSSELQLLQMKQQLIELVIQQENDVFEYERVIAHSKQQLLAQIEQWLYSYLITTPVSGDITFTNYWSNNQTIQTGERLASIIPQEEIQVIGRMVVPSAGMGKIEIGQKVNVKLNGYPYMQYGYLKGIVKSISNVPEVDGYIAEINFPDGLESSYKKKVGFIQQMDGTGEIITQDVTLLGRFFQPVRAVLNR